MLGQTATGASLSQMESARFQVEAEQPSSSAAITSPKRTWLLRGGSTLAGFMLVIGVSTLATTTSGSGKPTQHTQGVTGYFPTTMKNGDTGFVQPKIATRKHAHQYSRGGISVKMSELEVAEKSLVDTKASTEPQGWWSNFIKGMSGGDEITPQEPKEQKALPDATPTWAAGQDLVFPWMGWSPAIGSPTYKSVQEHFPGAIPSTALHLRTKSIIGDMGLTPENTIFGTSICSDEINNMKGRMADTMKDYWGEVFPLGGIGGCAFVGKTGFGAFSAHVPTDGNIVILFGPHVGVSASGELGKYLRNGQPDPSSACGAVLAAYGQCQAGDCGKDHDDLMYDMQQAYIRNKLMPHTKRISGSKDPLAALAQQSYNMVEESVMQIVNNNFGSGKLVLIGGIQMNMPDSCEDHLQPKMFKVFQKGQPTVDLLHTLNMPMKPESCAACDSPAAAE